jgi:MFS family permease
MNMSAQSSSDALLQQIRDKRASLDRFLGRNLPRKRRLLNVTIIGGTLAAALTSGPAVGGPSFTAWLTMTLGLTSPSWRLLCGAAAACSLTATVATQLLKSQNVEEHVTRAQHSRAKLEVLEVGLVTGTLDLKQAGAEFLRCLEDVSFLESL